MLHGRDWQTLIVLFRLCQTHIVTVARSCLDFLFCLWPFKNVRSILGWQAIQKQATPALLRRTRHQVECEVNSLQGSFQSAFLSLEVVGNQTESHELVL